MRKKERRKHTRTLTDIDNHEGLMMSNQDCFKYLVKKKDFKNAGQENKKIKHTQIDNFLARLYLAL